MTRPPILDPLSVPVIGTDAHLPPVPARRLRADALRERFGTGIAWEPEITGDGRIFAEREPAHASVLVPLVAHDQGVTVLLTRRTEHLRDHAGQISFPGGRAEDSDDDAVHTALREAQEEVGLTRDFIEPIGYLDVYATGFGFRIVPTVARVRPGFRLWVNAGEVDDVFEVPLKFLMDPINHQRHSKEFRGVQRSYYAMPFEERYIWGATAGILRVLYERIYLS